ncbi:MAG: flavoprotein [Sedimentisphaerales bacterium]|jgi:phosphopantothenoylcysteine decarboxylase/phosphopantothenate--cysteine ligase
MAKKESSISGLNVLLGVSGGVAAYKAVDLASKLTAAGALVDTVMTESACKFIVPRSFEAVTGRAVYTSMWENPAGYEIEHISLADRAGIVVVAPATANIIGKVANGICDELLSTTLCACWQKKVLFAPAMNEKMWLNPAVQWNVKTLNEMGFEIIGPEKGRLACGTEGIGRMAEVSDIIERIQKMAKK